jgi:hypothetical protein
VTIHGFVAPWLLRQGVEILWSKKALSAAAAASMDFNLHIRRPASHWQWMNARNEPAAGRIRSRFLEQPSGFDARDLANSLYELIF